MRSLLFILFLGMVFFSCAPKSREAEEKYIDVDGLINSQLQHLQRSKPTLTKQAGVNGSRSVDSLTLDSAGWANELEVFRSLGNLNQRVYAGGYSVEGPLDDPLSNLLIRQYTNPNSPLRSLKVYYQANPERIRQLEGEVEEVNPLYSARRRMSLWFEDEGGAPMITRYEIIGFQKAALRDTVHFRVEGIVGW